MSDADTEQWRQFDQRIRENNRLAIRTIKEWQAARSQEQDVLDGKEVRP